MVVHPSEWKNTMRTMNYGLQLSYNEYTYITGAQPASQLSGYGRLQLLASYLEASVKGCFFSFARKHFTFKFILLRRTWHDPLSGQELMEWNAVVYCITILSCHLNLHHRSRPPRARARIMARAGNLVREHAVQFENIADPTRDKARRLRYICQLKVVSFSY